ncbi:MAG: amidohydrolase family protein [candidate division Zixibacteria bacterium]|nr:amidohydrolase family protein [candidate division Zixibacteria bacterium]
MKTPSIIIALLIAGGATAQTTPPQGIRSKNSESKAFTHATIIISPTQTIENGTMIIKDGRVVAVGTNIPVPAGAFEYDLKGKRIYPGFIEPYGEYGLKDVGKLNEDTKSQAPKYEGTRVGANAWNDAIHAERNWVDDFKPEKEAADKFLEQGITVVQSSKMDGIFRGRSFVTDLSQGLSNEAVIKAHAAHFGSFNKGTSNQQYPSSLMGSIALIRQSFIDADWYAKAHTAYAKNSGQKLPEFNSAIAAIAENKGPIFFEVEDELTLLRAAILSKEFSVPFVYIGSNLEYARIAEIAAVGAPVILPVVFPKKPEVKSFEDALDVNLGDLRHWERAPYNASVLEKNKVPFAFTTLKLKDKSDFLKNVRQTIESGLSPAAALAALTTIPAQLCGVSSEIGTLEKGKLANFFISDYDIFSDSAKIYSVWIRGNNEKENVSIHQKDFRGQYSLSFDNRTLSLNLKGKMSDPKGELKEGDKKAKLEDLSMAYDRIYFSAPTDSLAMPGTTRFTLLSVNNHYVGTASLADGRTLNMTIAQTGPFVAEADTSKKEDEKKDTTLVSMQTFPDMAFGYPTIPTSENVLIKNATIWTCDDQGTLENTDMLVINGKISKIGKNLTAASGARVIDAAGKHLTAGIIDEHSHIAISKGVNEGSHAVTAEVRIGDVVNSDDINTYRALAGGVTAVQLLHGSANPIGGQAQVIKLKWGQSPEKMKFAAAPPSIKFALGENVKQSNWGDDNTIRYPQTRMGVETIMKDGFQAALEYEAAWRAYNTLGKGAKETTIPPRRDIQLDALVDILSSRMFVHCHSYVQTEILMLMRLAEDFGFKITTFTHILEGYKVADEMAAHGASASSFSDWWAYKFEVYDAIPYNTCLMHERGVLTCINSDSPEMGRRLNQEAAKSVMYCGIPEAEAIKFATLNPAIMLKINDRVGSLKAGKDADFVIWNDNPLSMYAHAEQTWIEGACYFSIEKDAQMRESNRKEKNALIQKALNGKSPSGGGAASYSQVKDEKAYECEDRGDVWDALNNNK